MTKGVGVTIIKNDDFEKLQKDRKMSKLCFSLFLL